MIKVRNTLDSKIENDILIYCIASNYCCKNILNLFKKEYIQNKNISTILEWCFEYYRKYEKAPEQHIIDIYNTKKNKIDIKSYDIIGQLLEKVSEDYESIDLDNENYFIDKVLEYFKKVSFYNLSENIRSGVFSDDIRFSEKAYSSFKSAAIKNSEWFNPVDSDEIIKTYSEDNSNKIFSLPGRIGEYIGEFERGWLVGILGPPKKGKTFYLQEVAFEAFLAKKKVIFISLEMSAQKTKERLYKRLYSFVDDRTREVIIPVFDCKKNQTGECNSINRKNKTKLTLKQSSEVLYSKKIRYTPCTYCREQKNEEYEPALWKKAKKVEKLDIKKLRKEIEKAKKWIGDNIRYRVYPPFSASITDIRNDIDYLEETEEFIPDVIVIDYLAICKPDNNQLSERGRVDDIWMKAKQLAEEKHCLVLTGHQGNRKSIETKDTKQTHVSEDMRVLAHCDLFLSLNQIDKEKELGVMRIGVMIGRHRDFNESKKITVLNSLELGKAILDSEWADLGIVKK